MSLMALASVLQSVNHEFVFVADGPLHSVSVAGTFNGWDKGKDPMKVGADGLTWRLNLSLKPGKHSYKFVLDGDRWIVDPKAFRNESDGQGNTNSILLLTPRDYSTLPGVVGDGTITKSAIVFTPVEPGVNLDRGNLTVRIQTRKDDVQKVVLVTRGKGFDATPVTLDDFVTQWSVVLPWRDTKPLSFHFNVVDGKTTLEVGRDGIGRRQSDFVLRPGEFKPFAVPAWVERSVIYQIFPDRFANGDQANDPRGTVDWGAKPSFSNWYGGDAAGVSKHLGYLKDLGVKAVYFNPLFLGPSNHRYETTDYRLVDPRFGTNEEFNSLVKKMHKDDIKVVLDGVFNHTSVDFFAFRDVRDRGKASPYKDWYFIKSYPVVVKNPPPYEAWFGFPSLPKLNTNTPGPTEYIFDTLDFWNRNAHIDGWRLDAANEVDPQFWPKFRQHLKSLGKDKWIVGEIWGDGSPWLQGDMFDSVMNYQFRDAVLRFVAHGESSATVFLDSLMRVYNSYLPQVSRNMMNLLGSHDTPRFLTECGDDPRLAKLGALVQFTWVGAPSVYYGDELGMEGGRDPDNRRGMRWDLATPGNDYLKTYKTLARVRLGSEALMVGDPVRVVTNDQRRIVAYGRAFGGDAALVVINRSDAEQSVEFKLPASLRLLLTSPCVEALSNRPVTVGADSKLRLTLAPLSGAIVLPAKGRSRLSA